MDWPTPEWERELSRIARSVAGRADVNLRDDTHQEIWLKFIRWPPANLSYAWKAANSARNSLWRKEATWRRLRDIGPEVCNAEHLAKASAPPRLGPAMSPKEKSRRNMAWYNADIEKSRASVRARVRAHRLKHPAPPRPRVSRLLQRNKEIGILQRDGMRIGDIAERYGLSTRSIDTALAAGRAV